MARKLAKSNFNSGQLSPYIDSREDIEKYYNGCSKLENGIVLPYGGVVKRSGLGYIATCKTEARLIPFQFSTSDVMVVEMGDKYFRFYKNDVHISTLKSDLTTDWDNDTTYTLNQIVGDGGVTEKYYRCITPHKSSTDPATITTDIANWVQLEDLPSSALSVIYEIYHPYALADLWDIHYVQSGDVIYMAHENYPVYKLSRIADNNWTITEAEFEGGAFLDENTNSAYLVGFARTGGTARSGYYFPAGTTGTLTASGTGNAPFNVNMVGSLWQVSHTRTDNILTTADNDANTIPTGVGIRILGDYTFECSTFASGESVLLWRKEGNGDWQEYRTFNAATIYTATENIKDVFYTFTRNNPGGSETTTSKLTAKNQINNGVVKITGYTSTTVVSATVVNPVLSNNTSDVAVDTSMWSEGAWSKYRGYPRTIGFYEDRLWLAGSTNNPQTLWSSKTSDYENFTGGANADDAITFTINTGDSSAIQWISSRELMFVGTSSGEFIVSANNPDNPVSPTDIKIRDKSFNGSNHIQPKILNEALFFSQGQGRILRSLRFTLASEQYEADNVTILNNIILESPPKEMAIQKIPDSILWIVRQDGGLVSFTYDPKETVTAFAEHFTKTEDYTSNSNFISICSIRGQVEDEIYVVVKRYIGSTNVYYLEKFSTRLFDTLSDATMTDSFIRAGTTTDPVPVLGAGDTVLYNSGGYGSGYYGGIYG